MKVWEGVSDYQKVINFFFNHFENVLECLLFMIADK